MIANWSRLRSSHWTLAPRSSTTDIPLDVGSGEAMAGRSTPGTIRSSTLASAISAPVLPAEITACASPSFTASIARRMELSRLPPRRALAGLSSPEMATLQCVKV